MALASDLARFATARHDLHATLRQSVLFSLFDWSSVGLAGQDQPVARAARAMALDEDAAGQAGLFGGGRATARAAALVNGAASHALDYDDTHFLHIGHPSVAIMPAAMAVAEARGLSWVELIDALVVGLELSCRIGDWLGRAHYEAGFHQTGTAGAFGATAAAGRLLGLDSIAMGHALCLTATRAAGLKSQFGTMGKPLNAGFAAEVGVTCALLALHGTTSNVEAIDGPQGFGPTHAGNARSEAWNGLGESWIFPAISYKFHACCHGLHAMLEAIRELRENGLDPENIDEIRIATHPRWLAVCNQPAPETGLGAKFSYRLTAAMGVRGVDTAALATFSDTMTRHPDLIALRDRVHVDPETELTDVQARVTVTTSDGTQEAFHDLAAALEPAQLENRLRAKSVSLIGRDSADALWDGLAGLGPQQAPSNLFARLFQPLRC